MRAIAAGAALALCMFATATAGPFEDAVAAYNRGDYVVAAQLWRPLADQGYAGAQTNLGVLYHHGQGVPQNYTEAARWYRKAADQGYAPAQFNLGLLYNSGQGIPQDYVRAYMWLSLAASHPPAGKADSHTAQRDAVAARLTPAQLAEGQRLAREWRPTPR